MDDFVSLKMTAAEAKDEGYGSPSEVKPPKYPWGTSVTLVDEVAKALFPNGVPATLTECSLDVKAYVKGVNTSEGEDSKPRLSVELQFTDIKIEDPNDTASIANRLYAGKKD